MLPSQPLGGSVGEQLESPRGGGLKGCMKVVVVRCRLKVTGDRLVVKNFQIINGNFPKKQRIE